MVGFHPADPGSNPGTEIFLALITQLVECWSYEPKVAGSSPAWSQISQKQKTTQLLNVVYARGMWCNGSMIGFDPIDPSSNLGKP